MVAGSKYKEVTATAPTTALLLTVAAICSILPVLYYVFLIVTTCSDSLSNDYLAITPLITAVALGGLKGGNLIDQVFYGVHFALTPVLVSALNCVLLHWSPRAELLGGLMLAVAKTLLLWHCVKTRDRYGSAILLFLLSLVQFGGSQASVFLYGMTSICWGFVTTGFALSLWALVKLQNRALAITLMLTGGLVSSFTEANVPPCWLALLIPIVFWRPVKVLPFVLWLVGGLIGIAPYAYLALCKGAGAAGHHSRVFNFAGVLDLLGRLLLNDTVTICSASKTAQLIGGLAIILAGLLLGLLYKYRTEVSRARVVTALSLILYGLGSAYILAVFRATIAPWYVSMTSLFWSGLCILLVESWSLLARKGLRHSKLLAIYSLIAAVSSLTLVLLYSLTNFSYRDKDWFRRSHSPSSQSVMRQYQTAPTYGIAALTAGELVDYETVMSSLATIYKHGWVANRPHQSCSLQGDFVLAKVAVNQPLDRPGLIWIEDRDLAKSAHWDVPEHLNAYLPQSASIIWQVDVPLATSMAQLTTAVALPVVTSGASGDHKLQLQIRDADNQILLSNMDFNALKDWSSINIDLTQWRGRRISIAITAAKGEIVLRYPEVRFVLSQVLAPKPDTYPSNVQGSEFYPKQTDQDLVFVSSDAALWHFNGLEQVDKEPNVFTQKSTSPSMIYAPALDIDIAKFSHFCIGVAVPNSLTSHNLCVQLTRNNADIVQFIIPLLRSDKMQNYSYDLKLCGFKYGDRITGLTVMPVYIQPAINLDKIKIGTMRLIHHKSANQ